MPKSAQKWVIGFAGFLAVLAFKASNDLAGIGDEIGTALAFGLVCGLISMLRGYIAPLIVAAASAFTLLLGLSAMNSPSDGSGMAGTFFYLAGMFFGLAVLVAQLGKALFGLIDRAAAQNGESRS